MSEPSPSRFQISRFITPANVCLTLKADQRDGVLAELVACIPAIAKRPDAKAKLLQALKEREELHSTGIGDGIALPHARTALPGLVDQPVIVVGRHTDGIGYRSVDNKPAHLFFLLVATTVSQHLQILARVSRLLRDATLRKNLMAAREPSAALKALEEAEMRL